MYHKLDFILVQNNQTLTQRGVNPFVTIATFFDRFGWKFQRMLILSKTEFQFFFFSLKSPGAIFFFAVKSVEKSGYCHEWVNSPLCESLIVLNQDEIKLMVHLDKVWLIKILSNIASKNNNYCYCNSWKSNNLRESLFNSPMFESLIVLNQDAYGPPW